MTSVVRWLRGYWGSSVGCKQTLALAGLVWAGFLGGHMLGNVALLKGDLAAAQASYNAYSAFLTGLTPLIWLVEAFLAAVLAGHAGSAAYLYLRNRRAAGRTRYAVSAHKGAATPAARTMLLSGLVILIFLIQHLAFFKFGTHYLYRTASGATIRDMWLTVALTFARPVWTLLYTFALAALAGHLVHALPAALRTWGLVHARWTPLANLAAVAAAGLVVVGFLLPAWVMCARMNADSGRSHVARALANQSALAAQAKGDRP